MTWATDQIPNIDPNDPYSYPEIDPIILLQMDPTIFNQWRREFDFPRIVRYLRSNLDLFEDWMENQNVDESELIYFGPARFIKPNNESIFITESNKESQEDKKRIFYDSSKLRTYLKKPSYYGEIKIIKKIITYYDWVKKKRNIIDEEKFLINRPKWTSGESSLVKYEGGLRLINIGSIYETGPLTISNQLVLGSRGGWNSESKILEFLNFDFLSLNNTFWIGECDIFFSSFDHVKIENCSLAFLNFFNTSLEGMIIENSKIDKWKTENSNFVSIIKTPENIERCQITNCEFINTTFFRFYNSLKINNCSFTYKNNKIRSYSEIKNLYNSIGDYYNSGKYYYFEQKGIIQEKINIYNYLKINHNINEYSTSTNDAISFLIHNEIENNFLTKTKHYIILFFLILGHYSRLSLNFFNYLARGFGEKPFRILLSFIPLIIIFTVINTYLENYESFSQLMIDNSFNMFGKFELDSNNRINSAFRVFKAAFGVFLISLFVADLSAKKRY